MSNALKPAILVVDDFAPMRKIYRHFLRQMGLRVFDLAANGAEALALLETRRYAVVIADWHMEPMTGFQLLQSLRAEQTYADLKVIMATAESRPDHIRAAERAGATDYIIKPFTVATLRSSLASACPRVAAAMEPPILAVPARENAARFRMLIAANIRPTAAVAMAEPLVEALAGPRG